MKVQIGEVPSHVVHKGCPFSENLKGFHSVTLSQVVFSPNVSVGSISSFTVQPTW